MEKPNFSQNEQKTIEIKNLDAFDVDFFKELEGENGWIAIGQENCQNQKYFTVIGTNNEKIGIVGIYDTEDEKNIVHVVVDKNFRGLGLDAKFKQKIMDELNLDSITITIDLDNTASIRATEKLPGVKKTSDEQYEKDFRKEF